MHYHIILTELCNSQCRYCYEKSMKEFDNNLDKKFKFDFSGPAKTKIDIERLRKFLKQDREAVLVFYGGEPLLEIDKIKEIIDNFSVPFRMQTNGKLLHKLPAKYMNKIDKILVSLDGDKERTDFNRGSGTYDLVMKNISLIKRNGFKGEIVARMTIESFSDIYEQVLNLVNAGFLSIHWQLDAGFYKFDFVKKRFLKFIEDYNAGVSKLIDFWVGEMSRGRVLKFYPFLGILNRLLGYDKEDGLMCGAGSQGYAISTDGKIVACPIMNCIEDFKAGDLDSDPRDLKKFKIDECRDCSYYKYCGGRCMYWRKANLWPDEGNELVCDSIKHLIDEMRKKLPEIKKFIENQIVEKEDLEYEKYFGPEIIP